MDEIEVKEAVELLRHWVQAEEKCNGKDNHSVHGKALITVCDLIECKEGLRLEFMTKCCACGKNVDMREVEDGGDPDGAELSNGRWVCSGECWDTVVEREEREQKYRDIIIELSRCLVGMTPGGSEYMKRFDDNLYYADVKICEDFIRSRFNGVRLKSKTTKEE